MGTKTHKDIPVACITVSRFNTRRTRPEADIESLAGRIRRNGFEATRAPWVYPVGDGFEVFAGGTRVEAARRAGLVEVPAFVHDGFAWEDIARLADEDNENDEYHCPVPVVDLWAEYHRLKNEEGWKQNRIAGAKGVDESEVSRRIKWHEIVPEHVKVITGSEKELEQSWDKIFTEGHIRPIFDLVGTSQLSNWLTTENIHTEAVAEIRGKHRGSSKGERPTVPNCRETARRWQALVDAAKAAHDALAGDTDRWQKSFVAKLVESEARTVSAVERAKAEVLKAKEEEIAKARRNLDEESAKAEAERKRIERVQALTRRIRLGDAREVLSEIPAGFHLLLTDPPYGQGFRSNRRVTTPKKGAIPNDDPAVAAALLRDVLALAHPRMADDAAVFAFTGWRHEPEFRQAVEAAGFAIRNSLVWVKNNHGTGDLKGAFAPKHERIIYAVKGSIDLRERLPDVLYGKDVQDSEHPTEKPVDLLSQLIRATTDRGQTVVDPFAGSGSTLYAAHALGREFHGVDVDPDCCRTITDRLHEIATREDDDGIRVAG